jgi:serine/threonine protein kinase
MTRQVIGRDKLGVLTKIAQGGQGIVYQAPNVTVKFAASMVYKEYKPQTRTAIDVTALAAMPALVEDSLSYAQAEQMVSIAAWPCALVDDNGATTGFVMPAIPPQFFTMLTTAKGSASSAAEFQHLLNHSSVLAARGVSIDDAQRYSLLRETAAGLAFLHKHGVCVGDISPKNLLFSLTPHPAVYFIDCDAMRINSTSVLPQVETPGWQVPAGEELATIYSDSYKIGLLALRLLVGDHDTTNPAHLPATTPDLLRQVITDTLTNPPQRRPLPEAWNYVLGSAIEAAQHRAKLTAAPASVAPIPPPVPEVRSRPAAHTAPPVRPPAQPIPTLYTRPPVSPPPPEWAATTPQHWWSRLGAGEIAIVAAAAIVVVMLTSAGLTFTLLRPHPGISLPPAIATSSAPTMQPAPTPVPTAQPAPSATPITPTSQYLKTQWGATCEVNAKQVICQACIPGSPLPGRQTCTDPAPGHAIDTVGTLSEIAAVNIDSSSDLHQLSDDETYHAFGWTIVGSAGWARFINDATSHGAALAPQNFSQI